MGGMGFRCLPRLYSRIEYGPPGLAPVAVDVIAALGLDRLGLGERGIGPREIVREQVVATQVVPRRGRALVRLVLLGGARHGLRQHPLRVLQLLGALVGALRAERLAERLNPVGHEGVRLHVARGGEEDVELGTRARRDQGGAGDENGNSLLDGHAHSLDLATSASASRCTTRATSSGGRHRARAAERTSSYSGFTRTRSASGCSSTFTRTDTVGASSTVTWRRAKVDRSAPQRRMPAVVEWRNSAAVTASASSSGATTSTRNPARPFFICTGQVCTSRAPAATSACRSGSTYSGLISSTSVARSATRPASAACSATRIRRAFGYRFRLPCPAPQPLPTNRQCPGGGPAASTRTTAAPVGVVASPSTGPPAATSSPSSRIAVAGARTRSGPGVASTQTSPAATDQV